MNELSPTGLITIVVIPKYEEVPEASAADVVNATAPEEAAEVLIPPKVLRTLFWGIWGHLEGCLEIFCWPSVWSAGEFGV